MNLVVELIQLLVLAVVCLVAWLHHRRQAATRRQLEALADELREAKLAAEAANRTKSQFLANMSHELRTPFQGVIGMLQLLEQGQPTPAQRDLIRTAQSSADHLLTLLNDVLDVSAIEAGRVELKPEPLNLHRLCHDVGKLMRGQATERGLRLAVHIGEQVPGWVEADATRLKQILLNLLSNAIKFTPGGEVRLDVDGDPEGSLRFTVTDTGIGMDAATLERLFRRFEMGDDTLSRRFGGAGLGLEISRELARMMGGDLTAESQPGKGSRFLLTAALPPCAAPVEQLADAALRGPDRALTVLVADDHPVNRKYLALLLGSMGHRVMLCEDGAAAVAEVQRQPYDVVLMDVHMPVLDGLAATTAIRALGGKLARIPILMLTADVLLATRERAAEAGVTAYLPKPVQAAHLADALAAAVGVRPALPMAETTPAALSSRFAELSDHVPSAELPALLEMFFADAVRTISDVDAAVRAGDHDAVGRAAHKLKGSARMLGFRRIAAVADDIEARGAGAEAAQEWPQTQDRLVSAIEDTRHALESRLALGLGVVPS